MKPIIIIGVGGQARETVQLIHDINKVEPQWNLLGYSDHDPQWNNQIIKGYPVLGTLEILKNYKDHHVIVAIGSSLTRRRAVDEINQINSQAVYATLIHPTSVIAEDAIISSGCIIAAHTVISTQVQIGRHNLVNYNSSIGHDAILENYVTILPGARVSGDVILRTGADIGSGACILPQKEVGPETKVGAGAVVTKSLPGGCTAVGVPAKVLLKRS